ncbi:MAG: RNA polymerase sigma-70 factor [Acidimicrobiales bacterium]
MGRETVISVSDFEEHRHHLFGVAYRMLGRVAEAEDVVQEAWLRWQGADHAGIRSPRAWLTTVVSRLAIDRLRSAQHRREEYVGPWLPEPLVAGIDDDPAAQADLAESLSLAFLTLPERLDPLQRAAFLLREVFDYGYDEIAPVIDRSEVACRQIVHRAKERLGPDRPPRFVPDPDDERRLIESFLAASGAGDVDGLRDLLAADVVAWSDGGATRHAARRPVIGAERVARFVVGIARNIPPDDVAVHLRRINGDPGVIVRVGGEVLVVLALEIGPDGITALRTVLAPEKLTHLARGWSPGRAASQHPPSDAGSADRAGHLADRGRAGEIGG